MTQNREHSSGDENSSQDRHILAQVADSFWACDLNLELTYLSPSAEKLNGFSAEERKNLSLEPSLTSASISTLKAIIAKHSSIVRKPEDGPDTPARCRLEIYRKDGSSYFAEANISFIRNDKGELTGLVGSNRNITERVRAEDIIKAIHDDTIHATGEQYLNGLVRHLSKILNQRYAFIAEIDKDISHTLAFCKDGEISENFSYSLDGSPCENVVAGAMCYYPENAAKLFPHEAGLKRMGIESYIGTAISDASGEVQGLLVLMHDQPMEDLPLLRRVLEVCADRVGAEMSRRKVQSRLEDSEQRFRSLFEQSIDPCFIHDEQGNITNANQSMTSAFAYSTEEFRHLHAIELYSLDSDIRATVLTAFAEVITTGSSRFETCLKRKSGETFPAELTAQLINIDGKNLVQSFIRDLSEQYRLREEEKNTQQTLTQLFDDLQTFIVIANIDGTINYTNTTPLSNPDAYEASTLDKKIWEYLALSHSLDEQTKMKTDIDLAIQGKHTQSDVQMLTPKGLHWIQVNMHPMRDSTDRVVKLLIEGIDIDHRKKMAEQLLYAEQRRELFHKQSPMPLIEWSIEPYAITEWNDTATELFGFTFDEVKGKAPEFLVPPKISIDKQDIVKTLNSTYHKVISKNRCKNGHIVLCEWFNSPIKDSSEKIIAVVSIVRDITAEHQAQQALLNRDAEQREILNTMLDAVLTLDGTGKILSFNHSAETLFGYTSNEIIGQPCWPLLPEQYRARLQHYMQRYIETEDPRYVGVSISIEGLRKDDSIFPSRLAVAPLGSSRNRFIISLQDLTQFKLQEQQLMRNQKMDALGKLTGGIAHDFNNMLGVITGYASLLQGAAKGQPKLERYAKEISSAGERGAQLTEKLLGFSQQKPASATKFSINTLLHKQQDMLQKSITPRIKLVYDLTEDLWPVYMDSGDLVDAILNISINAMHAMPAGGQLSITTRNEHVIKVDASLKGLPKGDYVLLSLNDNGHGMDHETQEKIFDPFFSTKGELGTGLGLSQVYGLIERSNGSIKVYSELGQGTRLNLYFPRYHELTTRTERETKPTPTVSSRGKETILVVDDEAALLELTVEILRMEDYQVIPASSGQQALDVLKNTPVDLLLSDIIMPEMDGYQLAATVQAQYPKVKIQLASGFTDDRHAENFSAELTDNILQKPFNIKDVLRKVRLLLEK